MRTELCIMAFVPPNLRQGLTKCTSRLLCTSVKHGPARMFLKRTPEEFWINWIGNTQQVWNQDSPFNLLAICQQTFPLGILWEYLLQDYVEVVCTLLLKQNPSSWIAPIILSVYACFSVSWSNQTTQVNRTHPSGHRWLISFNFMLARGLNYEIKHHISPWNTNFENTAASWG